MKKYYTAMHEGNKPEQEDLLVYLKQSEAENEACCNMYDEDIQIVYEVTLKPIKRIKKGVVELPLLKSKKKIKKR